MESIPGMRTSLDEQEFFEVVQQVGFSVIGQTGNLVPADKKLYALRDVTATVESIPLIASSVMSKKIAAGSDRILLDVKTGSGAFMKTREDSVALAREMVMIGKNAGRKTIALITDMDRPLGNAIGNALEIMEVCETLQGRGPQDLTELCVDLAAYLLYLADKGTVETCRKMAEGQIRNGEAFGKLKEMVAAQGGDTLVLEDYQKFPQPKTQYEVLAPASGWVYHMDTEQCGLASVELGAGRTKKEDPIDHSAGILLCKKVGDPVAEGDVLAKFFAETEAQCKTAEKRFLSAVQICQEKPQVFPVLHACVTEDGVDRLD